MRTTRFRITGGAGGGGGGGGPNFFYPQTLDISDAALLILRMNLPIGVDVADALTILKLSSMEHADIADRLQAMGLSTTESFDVADQLITNVSLVVPETFDLADVSALRLVNREDASVADEFRNLRFAPRSAEDVNVGDNPQMKLQVPESGDAGDRPAMKLAPQDQVGLADSAALRLSNPDGVGVPDHLTVRLTAMTCGRESTLYLSATDSDLTGGADFTKLLSAVTETAGTLVVSVAGSATETSMAFSGPGVPGVVGVTGNYTVEVEVPVGGTNASLMLSARLHRVNSSGVVQTSGAASAEQGVSLPGVKTFTFTALNLGTWAAGDRLRVDYIFRNPGAGVQSVTIRTGTTDAEVVVPKNTDLDPCGDTWVDQNSPTTTHGNETPLVVKGKSTLANDEQRAYVEFDLTRFTGWTANPGGTHRLIVRLTNTSGLLAVDVNAAMRRVTSRPFTESTATWNAPGTAGTLIKNVTIPLTAGQTRDALLTLSDAELNSLLTDGWLRVDFTGPTAASPITAQIVSREDATVAVRPRLELALQRA